MEHGFNQFLKAPRGKIHAGLFPGVRLLPTDRTAMLQSGSPPGLGRATPIRSSGPVHME